jgi:hypothetical protein
MTQKVKTIFYLVSRSYPCNNKRKNGDQFIGNILHPNTKTIIKWKRKVKYNKSAYVNLKVL